MPPAFTSSSSGKTSTMKAPLNPFQREIVAPDKFPRVRWHSARYVMICRYAPWRTVQNRAQVLQELDAIPSFRRVRPVFVSDRSFARLVHVPQCDPSVRSATRSVLKFSIERTCQFLRMEVYSTQHLHQHQSEEQGVGDESVGGFVCSSDSVREASALHRKVWIFRLHLSDSSKTFDDLEQVLLVIDDCAFDHYGKNVLLCRPYCKPELLHHQ